AIENLSNFIGIVGLVALLLGGIGVASGVRAFVERKIDTVAVLRCLGASSGQVLASYGAQAAAVGLVGAAVGGALGVAVQFVLPLVLTDFLPIDVHVSLVPSAVLTGLAVGGWIALIFALRPLLALRNVSPLQTLRRDTDANVLRMRWRDAPRLIVNAALILSVVAIALTRARTARQAFSMSAATGVDIQQDQERGLDSIVRRSGNDVVQVAPVVTMRISSINGKSIAELNPPPAPDSQARQARPRRAGWALRREFRSTYRDKPASSET